MSLTIWGRLSSVNVQKVVWCADELGIEYKRVDAGGKFGINDTPQYLAMNPNGLELFEEAFYAALDAGIRKAEQLHAARQEAKT